MKELSNQFREYVIMDMGKTLANKAWLLIHEDLIKQLIPEEWTSIKNLNTLRIGVGLEKLGVVINSMSELQIVLTYLERLKIILRFGKKVRRNPESIFKIVKPVNIDENANVVPMGN